MNAKVQYRRSGIAAAVVFAAVVFLLVRDHAAEWRREWSIAVAVVAIVCACCGGLVGWLSGRSRREWHWMEVFGASLLLAAVLITVVFRYIHIGR